MEQNPPCPTDAATRADAAAFVALMTPVVKVWLSEIGIEAANHGIQVFGGHGYVREWGMEQILRDIRIVSLYEGANGIQALDLVARKLPMEKGRMVQHLFRPIEDLIAEHSDNAALAETIKPLEKLFGTLKRATAVLTEAGATDPDALAAGSMDYLKILSLTALGFVWTKMVITAETDTSFPQEQRDGKRAMARFFFARVSPQADSHMAALEAGPDTLMELADASV